MRVSRWFITLGLVCWFGAPQLCAADGAARPIRLDISVLPEFEKYTALLAEPGYLVISLENNGLSPSLSGKPKIGDRGRSVEIRSAFLTYVGKKESVYSYEAGIALGAGGSKLTFPLTVDVSAFKTGKVVVEFSPSLAGLIPEELIDRIRLKVQMTANPVAQGKMLDYLGSLEKAENSSAARNSIVEAILLDAYRKSGGPDSIAGRDAGDAVPVSEQWMLILTLLIWVVFVPAFYVLRMLRGLKLKSRA